MIELSNNRLKLFVITMRLSSFDRKHFGNEGLSLNLPLHNVMLLVSSF